MAELLLATGPPPATVPTDKVSIYAKTDNLLYSKDENGTETLLGGAGGGGLSQDAVLNRASFRA